MRNSIHALHKNNIIVTMPTPDVLLRHFCKMWLTLVRSVCWRLVQGPVHWRSYLSERGGPPLVLCASLNAMGVSDTVGGILAVAEQTRGVCLSTPCNWCFSSPWMSLTPLRGPLAVADCPQPPFNWLAA